ncbi:uncharacterized protein LOC143245498 [Tachypleus tridentatus]|uniref:uncharacterized protein LOC143245498 n=1 Tax=Tachypleus tridentatus TaxID=6853 RepID=UPI003FD48FAD
MQFLSSSGMGSSSSSSGVVKSVGAAAGFSIAFWISSSVRGGWVTGATSSISAHYFTRVVKGESILVVYKLPFCLCYFFCCKSMENVIFFFYWFWLWFWCCIFESFIPTIDDGALAYLVPCYAAHVDGVLDGHLLQELWYVADIIDYGLDQLSSVFSLEAGDDPLVKWLNLAGGVFGYYGVRGLHIGLLNKNDFSARPGEQGSESPSENSKVFGHVRSENSSKKPLRPMTSPSTNDEMTRSSRPYSQSRGLFNKVLSDAELKSSQESEDMKLKEKSQTVMDLCRNLSVSIGQPGVVNSFRKCETSIGQPGVVNSFTKCETSLLSYQEMQEISIPENELKGSAKECWLVHRRLKVEGVHVPLNVLQRALMTPTEIRELTHSCSQYDFGERSKLLSSNNNE